MTMTYTYKETVIKLLNLCGSDIDYKIDDRGRIWISRIREMKFNTGNQTLANYELDEEIKLVLGEIDKAKKV